MDISQSAIRNPKSTIWVVGLALAGLLVALGVALLCAWVALGPPPQDLQDLTRFLLVSGGLSVLLGTLGFRLGLGTVIPSLGITIALVYLVGVVIVSLNVIYTATNMFLSREHDLPLLTVLLIFSAVISLFFAILMAQSMVSRLRALLAVARRVAEGDMSVRVAVSSNDEIGRLARELTRWCRSWARCRWSAREWRHRAASS